MGKLFVTVITVSVTVCVGNYRFCLRTSAFCAKTIISNKNKNDNEKRNHCEYASKGGWLQSGIYSSDVQMLLGERFSKNIIFHDQNSM